MRKFLLTSTLFCTLLLLGTTTQAQVSGIGYTLSPTVEYVAWNEQSGLDRGLLIGGKVGFSFGEFLELRGVYFQDLDIQTNFEPFGLDNFDEDVFIARDVDFRRYGGELKLNLSQGALLPYLTLGSGIQELGLDSTSMDPRKQIYVNGGLGIALSAADRFTFNLEAKNTQFNFNAVNELLTDEDRDLFNVGDDDFFPDRLGNWSFSAALNFYLGGRRPGELSELDKAYMERFSSGFRGGSVPVELTLGRMNFADGLAYRDTWMAGIYAGVDFGPYVGVRGFYNQALENGDLEFGIDPLRTYGGELRLKLNSGTGLVPYAIVGGGYLSVDEDEYIPRDTATMGAENLESQAFALGGVGVNLPISQNFKLFGAARAHLTADNGMVENLESTDDIQTSWLYNFGIKLDFGKKAEPGELYDDKVSTRVEQAIQQQEQKNDAETTALKQKYQQEIADLRAQLNDAYTKGDLQKAAELLREEEVAKQIVTELESRETKRMVEKEEERTKELREIQTQNQVRQGNYNPNYNSGVNYQGIQMSPAEFENLIDEILDGVDGRNYAPAPQQNTPQMNMQSMQEMLDRRDMDNKMSNLEKMITQLNERQTAAGDVNRAEENSRNESIRRDLTEFSAQLMNEIRRVEAKVNAQNSGDGTNTTVVVPGGTNPVNNPNVIVVDENGNVISNRNSVTSGNRLGVRTGGDYLAADTTQIASRLRYEGMSGFTGFNLGGQTTFNVGFRWHYGIGNSKLEFMPEAFFGFGSPSSFGLTGNLILPIELKNTFVTPYIGAGAGFMQIEEDENNSGVRLNYNVILGSYLNIWKGRLFVDLTARNAFKYNQIIAGYRFAF